MKIGPKVQEFMRQMMEERVAFNHLLGLKIVSFEVDAPRVRFDMRPELLGNPTRKVLHGGVISSTLDVAAGLAIMVRLVHEAGHDLKPGDFPDIGTIDLRVDYLRPGRGAYYVATGRVVRMGKRIAVTHMELVNDTDELIATGSAAYVVG